MTDSPPAAETNNDPGAGSQTGSCLCQAVTYRFQTAPIACVHCDCVDCQKVTGSGFATVFGLATQDLHIDGQAHLASFTIKADSGQTVTRQFCDTCGSQLFTLAQNNPDLIWIKAGSLSNSDWLQPTDSCWAGSATKWAPPDPGLNQHQGNPV